MNILRPRSHLIFTAIFSTIALCVLTLMLMNTLAAIEKVPTPQHADVPALDSEHVLLTTVLRAIVQVNGVDYAALRDTHSDTLERYRQQLAHAAVPQNDAAKMALYINAYNALTLSEVLRFSPQDRSQWPTWSVRSVRGFWKSYSYEVAGTWVTLDAIEHKILRPMSDPRVHFAVNCASKSCPALRADAYTEAAQDTQLEEQTQLFMNNPYHMRPQEKNGTISRLKTNKILSWFGSDFKAVGGVSAFIQKHNTNPQIQEFLSDGGRLRYFSYDWKLNLIPSK